MSTSGGHRTRWSPSGRELFFFHSAGALMGAPLEVDPKSIVKVGTPARVLTVGYFAGAASISGRTYDISPDGQRFLMLKDEARSAPQLATMTIVLNWGDELKRRFEAPRQGR